MVEKVSFFDIKLNSPHKDVVLIKGNESECDPILFEGAVKLSINQNMHLKKIKLCLIGEFSVGFFQRDERGSIKEQVLEKFIPLKVDWNNLLIDDQGEIDIGEYGDLPIKSYKLKKHNHNHHGHEKRSNEKRPKYQRAKSVHQFDDGAQSSIKLPTSGLDGTPFKNQSSNHSFLLPKGNYSLPFKVVLPTNICETVEGLSIGKMLYKFESSIHKGMFDKPITKYKYLRIFRTLPPTSISLLDNIDITNSWPGKVDYRVYLKRKGIAIGSNIPIKIMIVPLTKGLKLKRITAEIVQHYHVNYLTGQSPEFEQVCGTQQIMGKLDQSTLMQDRWDLNCYYKVPNNLKEITQTCTLNHDLIQVRHRLRVIIQIKNPQGGTISEMRANLPVNVYVSGSVGHVFSNHIEMDQQHGQFNAITAKDDAVFKKDRINSTVNSLASSTANSPGMSPNVSTSNLALSSTSVPDATQIQAALRNAVFPNDFDEALEMEDEQDEYDEELDNLAAPPLYEAAKFDKVFDINSPKSPVEQLGGEYFDLARASSREMASSPPIDVASLNRIPSYNEAVEEDDEGGFELAPGYDDTSSEASSNINLNLNKSHSVGSLSMAMAALNTNTSQSLSQSLNKSKGSSSNSSSNPGSRHNSITNATLHNRHKSHFKLHLPTAKKK